MHKVNRIVICRDKHESQEEFENAIRDAIMVLLGEDYIMTVRYDEPGLGIVCIDFNYADPSLGDVYPHWLSCKEYESVIFDEETEDD